MLKSVLINIDVYLSKFVSIVYPAYTKEDFLPDGSGAYSKEEWSKTRKLGYNENGMDCNALESDNLYLQRAFLSESRKFISALRLTKHYDFNKVRSVLEIGPVR